MCAQKVWDRPVGEVFAQLLTQSVSQISLPTALRTGQNQHGIWCVSTGHGTVWRETHTHTCKHRTPVSESLHRDVVSKLSGSHVY